MNNQIMKSTKFYYINFNNQLIDYDNFEIPV